MEFKVERREVKIAYLLANAAKELFRSGSPKKADFYQGRLTIKKRFEEMDENELDRLIGDEHAVRLVRYNALTWDRGVFPLADMGSWHGMDGLDFAFTTGNIVNTAKRFEEFPEKIKAKIQSIRQNLGLIKPNFLPIVIPGGLERQYWYNQKVRMENPDVRPVHQIFKYDIDAGNSRCLAFALDGDKSAEVYLGSYEGDLAELHEREASA